MSDNSSSQPSNGILTISQAAELLCVSTATIRRWFDNNVFINGFTLPSGERKIPAPSILWFMNERSMPIPKKLKEYLDQYDNTH